MRPLLARTLGSVAGGPPVLVYDEQAAVSVGRSGLPLAEEVVAFGTLTKASLDPADSADVWLLETKTKVGGGDQDDASLVWADGATRTSTDWPEPDPQPKPPGGELETKASSDSPDPKPRPPFPPRDDLATGVVSF